jgi:ubiquinone/menaquinone biosynthesis C-methylase UbiE
VLLLSREKLRRVVRSALGLPDNTTHKYWEKVAKENPYAAICTGWDASKFDSESENPIIGSELLGKEKTVLDVACGIGRMAKFISPKVKQYVGVDFSSGMIEKAKERYRDYSNVRFNHNDGKSFSMLQDNTFDLAVCYLAFQHMTKSITNSYINEVHRVLKPGGSFVTDIPRIDYYKDDKFAFTKNETEALFAKYSSYKYRPETGDAYFIIQATK